MAEQGKYDHRAIEKKWQDAWAAKKAFDTPDAKAGAEKFYFLTEFPYPSGNLHVGHWYAFGVPDIFVRYMRAQGHNVLYPIGFDAFGLPAENAAIQRGINPRQWTFDNIDYMRTQLRSMGASFDWSREVITADPAYYKWTQWLFLQFYKKGLVYRKETAVNWCPKDLTVLANEQVIEGKCERCGTEVVQRLMPQWNMKITDYADRLVDDLQGLNWPKQIKDAQTNWIGRSEGAEIDFKLNWPTPSMEVVFASNNQGKLRRMQMLFKEARLAVVLKTPKDIGIQNFDVVEDGQTLAENSEKKARALAALTDLPVFADDSGFYINNEKIDPVTVKRNALEGVDEKSLSVEEVALRMQKYYADIAAKQGGKVDAEWRNNLCFVTPEKFAVHVETVRPVTLTSESRGKVDPYLPLRGLYISKATGKYVLEQNEQEELLELKPITAGIQKLFTPGLTVFTTRPDTIFGATYLVLSPEHPFAQACAYRKQEVLENTKELQKYLEQAKKKTERERQEGKEKTGVELKGVKAINPATKEEIPIFVADYVLGGYGTGAIMAVPAHDERDFEFAQKFNLSIRQVVVPCAPDPQNPPRPGLDEVKRDTVVVHVRDKSTGKFALLNWHGSLEGITTAIMGGIESGQTPEEAALAELQEEAALTATIIKKARWITAARYCASHKNQNRCAHAWALLAEVDDLSKQGAIPQKEQSLHTLVWVDKEKVASLLTPPHQKQMWHLLNHDEAVTGPGYLMHSAEFDGLNSEEAKQKITEFVGGRMTRQYHLRDWTVSRQRFWGVPIPMVNCPKCGYQPIPEDQLPVVLPELEDYLPTGEGKSPLAKKRDWVEVKCPQCAGPAERETDTLDTFVDSSWYFLRYADPHNDREFAAKDKLANWMPVDLYSGGSEHTTMHLLYSRFWHKAMYDLGLVDQSEPYLRRMNRGLIMGPDGQKMSKSKGNVIDPDQVVTDLGADTVRMYLAFIGPYNEVGAYPWTPSAAVGVRRFLDRVWRLEPHAEPMSKSLEVLLNQTVKKVGEDIQTLKMNTAVSALMILLNELEKSPSAAAYETFLKLLAPFAPHLAHELAEAHRLDLSTWPAFDPAKTASDTVKIAIQVNGKLRATMEFAQSATQEEVVAAALGNPAVQKWAGAGEPKVVYVPGKILSLSYR